MGASENAKPKRIGTYNFTRSASNRYSEASSCTSYTDTTNTKLGQAGSRQVQSRRVLSDITNVQNDDFTPRKISTDSDSQCSELKRTTSVPRKQAGPVTTALSKCNVKPKEVQKSQAKQVLLEGITPSHCAQSSPSKLSSIRKKILDKVAGKSIQKPKGRELHRRSISKDKDMRRLSMILRSEQQHIEKSKTFEEQVKLLQQQCYSKESEIESVRNVGKMLGRLCVNQAEELKALKGMFPPTLREVVQLRDICKKQEKELRDARTVVPSLQEQVKLLTQQLDSLANDIEKVKAERIARRAGASNIQLKVNALLTKDGVTNPTADNDLVSLEDTCTMAFQKLGICS